jgi:hypothetical protein
VVAAIVIFAMVARLAIWLLPRGVVRKIVVIIDDIALIGLLLYFGWEMFAYLWHRRSPIQHATAIGVTFAAVAACLPRPLAKPLWRNRTRVDAADGRPVVTHASRA